MHKGCNSFMSKTKLIHFTMHHYQISQDRSVDQDRCQRPFSRFSKLQGETSKDEKHKWGEVQALCSGVRTNTPRVVAGHPSCALVLGTPDSSKGRSFSEKERRRGWQEP